MSRVGHADFYHSQHDPQKIEKYWRECTAKEYWDHPFHPLRERPRQPSHKDLRTSYGETHAKPWDLLKQSFLVGVDDGGASLVDSRMNVTFSSGSKRINYEPARQPLRVMKPLRQLRASASSSSLALDRKLSASMDGGLIDPLEASGRNLGTLQAGCKEVGFEPTRNRGALRPSLAHQGDGSGREAGEWGRRGPLLASNHRSRSTMPSFARIFGT